MRQKRNQSNFLILLGWLLYTTSYLGKLNYSANITQIIDFYGVTKAEAGVAPTFFFFAYGIGQVVNGLLCKKYDIKKVIFGSMLISASINLVIAVSSNFAMVKWLWMLNGFCLSVLWPTLIRLLSESLAKKDLGRSSVIIGTTVATGTLVIYALSSLFVALDVFKLSFYTAAIADFTVAFIWLLVYEKAVTRANNEREFEIATQTQSKGSNSEPETKVEKHHVKTIIVFLSVFAVGVNFVKDGLNTWVPSILKDEYTMDDSLAILLTLFLPIVAIFGNAFALYLHKIIPDYVSHCSLVFAITGCIVGGIIWSLGTNQVLVMLGGLIITSLLVASLNSLITSIFPMFMRGTVNSGMIAGILNGFCYIGSTMSSYGLGAIADHFGWSVVFLVLLVFCIFMCVMWCAYMFLKKRSTKQFCRIISA